MSLNATGDQLQMIALELLQVGLRGLHADCPRVCVELYESASRLGSIPCFSLNTTEPFLRHEEMHVAKCNSDQMIALKLTNCSQIMRSRCSCRNRGKLERLNNLSCALSWHMR
jgi:hypothetical protein